MDRAFGEVWDQFRAALGALDLTADFVAEQTTSEWDAEGLIEGVAVVIDFKAAPTIGDVRLLAERNSPDRYIVLVSRRISVAVRKELVGHNIGYFDARGHLRLWSSPLRIDTSTAASATAPDRRSISMRIDAASTLDIALAVLDGTVAANGVRATATLIGRSAGTVSKQLAKLRALHLLIDDEPVIPDLFNAVLDVWHPQRWPLAGMPRPEERATNARLQLGFEERDGVGWVLADTIAAAAWGAPIVIAGDAPPDFYVPDIRILRQARTLFGDSNYDERVCTVAVAPAPYVCRRRFDRTQNLNDLYFAPSPVIAALDLAADPGRGRETLDAWSRSLPSEVHRVW